MASDKLETRDGAAAGKLSAHAIEYRVQLTDRRGTRGGVVATGNDRRMPDTVRGVGVTVDL